MNLNRDLIIDGEILGDSSTRYVDQEMRLVC